MFSFFLMGSLGPGYKALAVDEATIVSVPAIPGSPDSQKTTPVVSNNQGKGPEIQASKEGDAGKTVTPAPDSRFPLLVMNTSLILAKPTKGNSESPATGLDKGTTSTSTSTSTSAATTSIPTSLFSTGNWTSLRLSLDTGASSDNGKQKTPPPLAYEDSSSRYWDHLAPRLMKPERKDNSPVENFVEKIINLPGKISKINDKTSITVGPEKKGARIGISRRF